MEVKLWQLLMAGVVAVVGVILLLESLGYMLPPTYPGNVYAYENGGCVILVEYVNSTYANYYTNQKCMPYDKGRFEVGLRRWVIEYEGHL